MIESPNDLHPVADPATVTYMSNHTSTARPLAEGQIIDAGVTYIVASPDAPHVVVDTRSGRVISRHSNRRLAERKITAMGAFGWAKVEAA